MAFEQVPESFEYARNAGEDLSAKLYYLVKVDTDDDIILAGSGQPVLGVIREGAVADKPVTVQFGGIAKVIAGASFSSGVLLMSDSTGKAVLATTTLYAFGMALHASGGSGEVVSVRLGPFGKVT